ncbi:hypothetical protein V8J36_00025 [Frigidibacter sp. MR17.14]|uniref:hypothetical protein n=1 Tax=Frigidibacter sp. MR17.14 TaxID=3126509 RepID=UPI003012CDE2
MILHSALPLPKAQPLGRADSAGFTARLMARDDADRDGRLSRPEAGAIPMAERLLQDFAATDADGDGHLTVAEFRSFADSLPPGTLEEPDASRRRAEAFAAALDAARRAGAGAGLTAPEAKTQEGATPPA